MGVGEPGTSVAADRVGALSARVASRSAIIERSLVHAAIASGVSDNRRRSFRRFRRGVIASVKCINGLNYRELHRRMPFH